MRKLITAALALAAMLGMPTVASAHDRDGWYDRGGYDRDWRDDRRDWRDDRRYWRDDRRRGWRDRNRSSDRRWRGRDVYCQTEWYYGDRRRVCYRR